MVLNNGRAYFVKSTDFKNYLSVVQPSDSVRNHSQFKQYNPLTTSTERHLLSFASSTDAEYCQIQERSYQQCGSCPMCPSRLLHASRHS